MRQPDEAISTGGSGPWSTALSSPCGKTIRRGGSCWPITPADRQLPVRHLHRAEHPDHGAAGTHVAADDYLYSLRGSLGEEAFPREAAHYLDTWASDDHAWLRKYYPANSDEPHYDITPATEKAIDWLTSLEQRTFVGTDRA